MQHSINKVVTAFPPNVQNGLQRVRQIRKNKHYGKNKSLRTQSLPSPKQVQQRVNIQREAGGNEKADKTIPLDKKVGEVIRLFDKLTTGKKNTFGK